VPASRDVPCDIRSICAGIGRLPSGGSAGEARRRCHLPELTEGFATLIPPGDDWYAYARQFLAALDQSIAFVQSDAGIDHLWRQVSHINATCTWAVRARQWVDRLGAGWGEAQRSDAPPAT
jgi:hypothetical protein